MEPSQVARSGDGVIDAEDTDVIEPVRVINEDPLALGQHGVVSGGP